MMELGGSHEGDEARFEARRRQEEPWTYGGSLGGPAQTGISGLGRQEDSAEIDHSEAQVQRRFVNAMAEQGWTECPHPDDPHVDVCVERAGERLIAEVEGLTGSPTACRVPAAVRAALAITVIALSSDGSLTELD